jgi:hypothetical protein
MYLGPPRDVRQLYCLDIMARYDCVFFLLLLLIADNVIADVSGPAVIIKSTPKGLMSKNPRFVVRELLSRQSEGECVDVGYLPCAGTSPTIAVHTLGC